MQETYRMMVGLMQSKYKDSSMEQLAIEYQKELNPSILAESFVRNYNFIFQMASGYYGLTEQDIASHALERLDFCLQTFKQGNSFLTYYGTVLKNKFREETQYLNTHKRKVLFHSSSYEVMVDNGFDLVASPREDEITNLVEDLREYGLDDREIEYCFYLLLGESNADTAKNMGCTIMTLCNMRKRMRIKLGNLASVLGF
jgi:DNA-directed RNA polymerase specialized sigma24 family protein